MKTLNTYEFNEKNEKAGQNKCIDFRNLFNAELVLVCTNDHNEQFAVALFEDTALYQDLESMKNGYADTYMDADTKNCGENFVNKLFEENITSIEQINDSGNAKDYLPLCEDLKENGYHLRAKYVTELLSHGFIKDESVYNIPEIVDGVAVNGAHCYGDVKISEGVIKVATNCFKNNKKIRSIDFPDSVEEVESGACCGCGNLTSVTFSNQMTTVERETFRDCGFIEVDLPYNIVKVDSMAFYGNLALENVNIQNPNCKIHEDAFMGTPYQAKINAIKITKTPRKNKVTER